jgi:hypothetical protein
MPDYSKHVGAQARDALLSQTLTLAAAAANVSSGVIAIGSNQYNPGNYGIYVKTNAAIPAADLPAAEQITIDILNDDSVTPTTVLASAVLSIIGDGNDVPPSYQVYRLPAKIDDNVIIRVNTPAGAGAGIAANTIEVGLAFERL